MYNTHKLYMKHNYIMSHRGIPATVWKVLDSAIFTYEKFNKII